MTKPVRITRIPENEPELVYGVEYIDAINMHNDIDDALKEWDAVMSDTDDEAVLVFGWRYQNGDIQWKNKVSA